jgi:hypothetical protein
MLNVMTMKAHRGRRGAALLFPNLGARRGWRLKQHPGRLTPGRDTCYPFYRGLVVPPGQSGKVRKISLLPDHAARNESLYRRTQLQVKQIESC